jgi:2-polyprenyl-6-methoxyphenol hydroxylase-like FAD-dependent oxidoreductase
MPSEREKLAEIANAATTDQVPEPIFRCNQMYVEAWILEHIKALSSVECRFGWKCVEISNGDEGVPVVIENVQTGEQETVLSRYVAGCDGPKSMLRRHLEIGYSGETPEVRATAAAQPWPLTCRRPTSIVLSDTGDAGNTGR